MNVFIAAKYETRIDLWPVRAVIHGLGHRVVSSWLDEATPRGGSTPEDEWKAGIRDRNDIRRSDLFILDTTAPSETGGREVELGFALAQAKVVWHVGPNRNIYHQSVTMAFDSWIQALGYLAYFRVPSGAGSGGAPSNG